MQAFLLLLMLSISVATTSNFSGDLGGATQIPTRKGDIFCTSNNFHNKFGLYVLDNGK